MMLRLITCITVKPDVEILHELRWISLNCSTAVNKSRWKDFFFNLMFQDIGHGFISFFLCPCQRACFMFLLLKSSIFKTCFIFHLFLCILCFLSLIISTFNKAATFRMSILFNKGASIKVKDATTKVYIAEIWQLYLVRKRKTDWMWPCSSIQYSWLCIHVGRLWLKV